MEIHPETAKVLGHLFRKKIIGGKHLAERFCISWIKHLPKQDYKQVRKDIEQCKKEGLFILKLKPGDIHISLNPERLDEIKELIKKAEHKS